ncbi:uncharacterized protein LOC125238702 [Leguminivora glycinivorella]|uniref:uncharacterized protein LOC125238702 n=1 Tax=Leguminivora glycinivorella TaxID=1035111 RepID=UPI00200EB5C9|nr:uncharacterized protein LOC125238702 [Leguminivora glycinivorella]
MECFGQSQKVHVKEETENDSENLPTSEEASALLESACAINHLNVYLGDHTYARTEPSTAVNSQNTELQYLGCLEAVHIKEEDLTDKEFAHNINEMNKNTTHEENEINKLASDSVLSVVNKAVSSGLNEVKDENELETVSPQKLSLKTELGVEASGLYNQTEEEMLGTVRPQKSTESDKNETMTGQYNEMTDMSNLFASGASEAVKNKEIKNEAPMVFLPSHTVLCLGTDIKDEILSLESSLDTKHKVSGKTIQTLYEVKNEVMATEPLDSRGVSEAAMTEGLYNDHTVKDEIVVGPENPHRPDAVMAIRSWALMSDSSSSGSLKHTKSVS